MSLLHTILFCQLMKKKKPYDRNNPPDYFANQAKEAAAKPMKLHCGVTAEDIHLSGVYGELLRREVYSEEKIILYIHGGGFVGGTAKGRRFFTQSLVLRTGFNVISIDYHLAPCHPFPAAPEDCFVAYRELEKRYGGHNIALVGDSAGGNLVLSVVLQAKDHSIPLPACVVSISPTVQYDQEFASYKENLSSDCMISNLCEEMRDMYFQSDDLSILRNPYGAPLYGDFHGFPPTLVIASDSEVLRDDSVEVCSAMRNAGCDCKLSLYPNMMHAFPILPMVPESNRAQKEIKAYLGMYLGEITA